MFELKYFDKIHSFEEAEARRDTPPLPVFNLETFGLETGIGRAKREVQRRLFLVAFWLLRRFWPVFRWGRTIIVSRHKDVCSVLADRDTFRVPYGPEMRSLTGGIDFVLGIDGNEHDTQRSIIVGAVRQRDDAQRIVRHTRWVTQQLLNGSGGQIDAMRDLIGRVMTEVCNEYFGLQLGEPNAFMDRAFATSAFLFADPFGSREWRRQALSGAVQMRHVVDRAIADAEKRARTSRGGNDTVLDRLVASYIETGTPSKDVIRSIAIGTIVGLIPTNTMGAGKVLEELLRRPEVLRQAVEAAVARETATDAAEKNEHRSRLKAILFEASRLNPGLSPGQWRYASKDAVIAGVRVRAGDVLMVSTMSALRDGSVFDSPGSFRPGRDIKPPLMFGDGSHHCLGKHLAMEQITEIFSLLLSQKNIRASEDAAGQLTYVGPFPRRLDMVFDTRSALRNQNMITIQAPLRPGVALKMVQDKIALLGNPASSDSGIGKALKDTDLVHFAALSAFDAADPDDADAEPDPRLVLELSVDGDVDPALQVIAREAGAYLTDIFALTVAADGCLLDVLRRQRIKFSFRPWETTGLNFNGTPDCPVSDIDIQSKVADAARQALDEFMQEKGSPGTRALTVLARIRRKIREHADTSLRAALIRPTRRRLAIAEWTGTSTTVSPTSALSSGAATYIGVFLLYLCIAQSALIYQFIVPASSAARYVALASGLACLLMLGANFVSDDVGKGLGRRWTRAKAALAQCVVWTGVFLALGLIAALACANAIVIYWLLTVVLPAAWSAICIGVAAVVGVALLRVEYLAAVWLLDNGKSKSRRAAIIAAVLALAIIVIWRLAHGGLAWPSLEDLGQMPTEAYAFLSRFASDALAWDSDALRQGLELISRLGYAAAGGIASVLLAGALLAALFLAILRWHEKRDVPDNRPAELDKIREIADLENPLGYAHNHITAVTPLKKGLFRRLTLAVALWGIGKLVTYWYRPGFVLNMGTIHYARWFRLPDSDTLVFFSNYDGSWESYLEDFVTKAHAGQTAAWSNGKGFPNTRYLILDGAEDGSRFKRWVRRQQRPTLFWYSRFPRLTTDQVRNNALIHHGLMNATTDTAAQAWLDCFGSMPRPQGSIETEEVQSLVFRGYPELSRTLCAAIVLPDLATLPGNVAAREREKIHRCLARLQYNVAFGENGTRDELPTFVAFSASGLGKLLGEGNMSAFPPAFRIGMGHRDKILRDKGDSSPDNWEWADVAGVARNEHAVDALIIVYGKSDEDCKTTLLKYRERLGDGCFVHVLETQPTPKSEKKKAEAKEAGRKSVEMYEHFGFRDGISQPVIRGTQRSMRNVAAADLVEPGEMILGYQNAAGFTTPAVSLPAELDLRNDLPTDVPAFSSRFPRFGSAHVSDLRDFGRNGSFIAVRQLQQHVERFHDFVDDQAKTLKRDYKKLEALAGCTIDGDWVAAKLMGRTREGKPLLGRSIRTSDNDFDFGLDDPQGLHCPFGAHIRRANPRGALQPGDLAEPEIMKRHRILRRGRPYGGEDAQDKGMLFVAICADIERQFEFLQQTWISAPSFAGLSDEPDPITASVDVAPNASGSAGTKSVFTIPTTAGPVTMRNMKSFVTMRAGGYFFMPSRAALRYLVSRTRSTESLDEGDGDEA